MGAVKHYQHWRFERSYAAWLAHRRYGPAARFFLDDLYGPTDFTARDAQFERVVPALVRLFPGAIVATVRELVELHAISERLDSRMATHVDVHPLNWPLYVAAWRQVGAADERAQQIALMLNVGRALDQYTRNRTLRNTLRLMRVPARMSGLSALQMFLERGFDTFGAMNGAEVFLQAIASCENRVVKLLFNSDPEALSAEAPSSILAADPPMY
jgi:hypothetical protein